MVSIAKPDVCPLLLKALLDFPNKEEVVRSGFMRGGIYPWCPDAVDYASLPSNADVDMSSGTPPESPEAKLMALMESRLTVKQMTEFRLEQDSLVWQGDITDTNLFYFWRNLKIYCSRPSSVTQPSVQLENSSTHPVELVDEHAQMSENLNSDSQPERTDAQGDTEDDFPGYASGGMLFRFNVVSRIGMLSTIFP